MKEEFKTLKENIQEDRQEMEQSHRPLYIAGPIG